jgi:predicted RecA/RadA family phage recombinase
MSLLQTPFEIKDPDYTEIRYTSGSAVAAGKPVVLTGNLLVPIAPVSANVEAAFAVRAKKALVAKAAPLVLAAGAKVYWDEADQNVNATSTDNTLCGYVSKPALSADTTVEIVFDGLN